MAKRFSQLPAATILNEDDIFAISQSFTSKKLTGDLTAKFILRNSAYADVMETITTNKDYTAAELEPDHRIFADSTGGDIILGLFNGSDRDGMKATIINVASTNVVNIELYSDGVTDIILNANETVELLWDNTSSLWQIVSEQLNGIYDIILNSQEDFNSIIERVAVNQYKIKDSIRSVFFKFLIGGYQMTGAESPLSDGDTWGYIKTNNCRSIVFSPNVFIDFHQSEGYLEINTDFCVLNNLTIAGDKGAASDIKRSYLLNASYVTFFNCTTNARLSNSATTFYGFEGSTIKLNNITSKYVGCTVRGLDLDGTGIFGAFKDCQNISNSVIYFCKNLNASGAIALFNNCKNINNTNVFTIESIGNSFFTMFKNCNIINSFLIEQIDFTSGGSGFITMFDTCNNIENGIITDIDSNDDITIFSICNILNNININNINTITFVTIFVECKNTDNINISEIETGSAIFIFSFCDNFNNIIIDGLTSTGSTILIGDNCKNMNNILISDLDADGNITGFTSTNYINNIEISTVVTGYDFKAATNCSYISNFYVKTITATNDIYGFENLWILYVPISI